MDQIRAEYGQEREIFDQISASLAAQYDTLYYVNIENDTYSEISSTDEYKRLNVPATGKDFFAESRRSIRKYVHPEDREIALAIWDKDRLMTMLEKDGTVSVTYRIMIEEEPVHINFKVTHMTEEEDDDHIIVAISNVETQMRREQELHQLRRQVSEETSSEEGKES